MRIARIILLVALSLLFIGGLLAMFDSRTHITGAGTDIGRQQIGVEYWSGWLILYHDTNTGTSQSWAYRDPPETDGGDRRVAVIAPEDSGTINLSVISWHDRGSAERWEALSIQHAVRVRLWLACVVVGLAWAALVVFMMKRRRTNQVGPESAKVRMDL